MSVIYVAVPPHTTLRLKGRLRCEVLRTEARCVEQHVWFCVLETAYSEQPSCVLGIAYMLCKLMLSLSVRYPHQLDMTYPGIRPPPKGRAPCRNLKTTRTLTPRCGVWIRYVLLPISINPNSSG